MAACRTKGKFTSVTKGLSKRKQLCGLAKKPAVPQIGSSTLESEPAAGWVKDERPIDPKLNVPVGSRIINIEVFFDCMEKGCQQCLYPIIPSRTGCIERQFGLASIFTFPCSACGFLNPIPTSIEHRSSKRNKTDADDSSTSGRTTNLEFDVNSKAAIGMIKSGIGSRHVNSFLSAMNIPAAKKKTKKYKKRKKICPASLENVVKRRSLRTVSKQRQSNNLTNREDTKPSCDIGFDSGPLWSVSELLGPEVNEPASETIPLTSHTSEEDPMPSSHDVIQQSTDISDIEASVNSELNGNNVDPSSTTTFGSLFRSAIVMLEERSSIHPDRTN